MNYDFETRDDPQCWSRPGTKHLLTIPRWLGGAWACSYIVRHAWTRWLILWPLIQIRKVTG